MSELYPRSKILFFIPLCLIDYLLSETLRILETMEMEKTHPWAMHHNRNNRVSRLLSSALFEWTGTVEWTVVFSQMKLPFSIDFLLAFVAFFSVQSLLLVFPWGGGGGRIEWRWLQSEWFFNTSQTLGWRFAAEGCKMKDETVNGIRFAFVCIFCHDYSAGFVEYA